ncbi:MAG: SPASM domain-containing protein [Candidatus Promineifilaceae bacterium]
MNKQKKNDLPSWLMARPAPPSPILEPGIHHYSRDDSGTYTRFHLRIDPDGQGNLLVNATVAARLSQSGAMIAKGLLDGKSTIDIITSVKKSFRGASHEKLEHDISQVATIISDLSLPGDNYPIINLDDSVVSSYAARLMAPMRADISIASNSDIPKILDRLWDVGIPHVTFVFGKRSEAKLLIRSVERAEDLGMIAGVRGRAKDLGHVGVARDLAYAGADYISLFYASADEQIHDGLLGAGDYRSVEPLFAAIRELEVTRSADIPLTFSTIDALGDTLFSLRHMDISNVNFFAIALPDGAHSGEESGALSASALPQIADLVEEWASESDVRYVWQPALWRNLNIDLDEQVQMGARCSDDLSVRIEPGGEVIPARGPYESAGNILLDEWESIWNHQSFRRYRERVEMPTRCEECPGLAICAADCPREVSGWSRMAGVELK